MPPTPQIPHPAPPAATSWQISPHASLDLSRPRILAILNATPDSFFTGSTHTSLTSALEAARLAADAGADMIDLGGESTRPGAESVSEDEQIRRTAPLLAAIRAAGISLPISIDTTRARVAAAALDAGADAVNDISAGLDDPDMLPLVARRRAGLILMHRAAPPSRDHYSDQYPTPPAYPDVLSTVADFLSARISAALAAGIHPASLCTDPGLGFGKSVEQNLALIRGTPRLAALGPPVLSALSRKSFVGRISLNADSTPDQRLTGTLALSVCHYLAGARLFRVHDVQPHRAALNAAAALMP